MKKIILALSLAVMMVMSGCASAASGVTSTAPAAPSVMLPETLPSFSNSEIAESLIARARNNADANSFEGFTYESTYDECLEKIGTENLTGAVISTNTEFLGYPSVIQCNFGDSKSGILPLERMQFTIHAGKQESGKDIMSDLLAKLDMEFGSHKEVSGYFNWEKDGFCWEKDGLKIEIYPNDLPLIIVTRNNKDSFPKTPGLFPYRLGTDFDTVYESLKPGMQQREAGLFNVLGYRDEGIGISLIFNTDETGEARPYKADYSIYINNMGISENIDYDESFADGLEAALGAPDERGYDIPVLEEYYNGQPIWRTYFNREMSAQDILDSGSEYFNFSMTWPGITFCVSRAHNTDKVEVSLDYFLSCFKAENK